MSEGYNTKKTDNVCHIFLFIDALGAAITEKQPVIRDVTHNWQAVRSVFGYSSACVPSIISGKYPEEHLHWNYFTYGRDTVSVPKYLRYLPPQLRDRGRIRRYLSPLVARHNNFDGYFQLYQMPLDILPQFGYNEQKIHSAFMA